jgi:hypothetical protein
MKLLITLLIGMGSFVSFGQQWQSIKSDGKIDIQFAVYHHQDVKYGKDHQRIIFKYENSSNEDLTINFDRIIAYDGQELSISPERNFTLTIPAHSELEFSDENKSKLFYIFSKDNNGMIKRSLTSFDVINLKYQ